MERARGTIKDGDITLVENIDLVLYVHDPSSGIQDWKGQLTPPTGVFMDAGRKYRLELDDGRSGTFLVTESGIDFPGGASVEFAGEGPLR